MFLITNREIRKKRGGPEVLGKKPHVKGPNELEVVRATKKGKKWSLEVLGDKATDAMVQETAKMRQAVGTPKSDRHITTYVAHKILDTVNPQLANPSSTRKGRNLLMFVHGYNNDVEDVLDRAHTLSKLYGVEVLPFSWPANGGGIISGTASYKSDKRDAKVSIGALDRTLYHMANSLNQVTEQRVEKVKLEAERRFPENAEERDSFITRMSDKECPFTVNLILHSMGNYLYKHLLLSTASEGTGVLFDNVVLAAADTNNKGHGRWVDRIRCRRRVYVTINEDDRALRVSRIKSGDEQLARLGHYPFELTANQAAYIQFTDASHVGRSHAYFEDAVKNPRVKRFFKKALNGDRAEHGLSYDSASNTFRI